MKSMKNGAGSHSIHGNDNFSVHTENIDAIRDQLVNKALTYTAILAPVAVVLSLLRSFSHGWTNIFYLHIVAATIVISFAIFKNRIPYFLRAGLLPFIWLTVGVIGLLKFGIAGGGEIDLILFVFTTGIFFGSRAGFIACFICLLVMIFIMLGIQYGIITYDFNVGDYVTSVSAWGAELGILALIMPIVIIAVNLLHEKLARSLTLIQGMLTQHQRLVNNLVGAFLYRKDPERKYNYVSSSVTTVLGYSESEFLRTFETIVTDHPTNLEAIEKFRRSLKGMQQIPFEIQVFHKNNGKVWLEISETPVRNKVGDVIAVEGVAHDITKRKKAEEGRALLATLIEQATEEIVMTDVEGTIEYVNPSFIRTTGYDRDEIIGNNPRILKSGKHDDRFYKALWSTITAGKIWKGRFINRSKSGDFIVEESIISPLFDSAENVTGYFALNRNITDQVALEKQLQQAQKMESLGTLAGGIAHDFNNLLGAIVGNTQLAMLSFNDGHERDCKEDLNVVLEAAGRASDLVKQILLFSRMESRERKPVRLNIILKEAYKLLRSSLPRSIEIKRTVEDEMVKVLADPTELHQIIMNLGTNASHAIGEENGCISLELKVVDEPTDESGEMATHCHLVISDDGCGIPEKDFSKIFEPFFTTKPTGRGTGLGLSVVHGIVKSLGGEISVDSSPGKGTTFIISLPVVTAEEIELKSKDLTLPSGRETILYVDDERRIANFARNLLKRLGYTVVICNDGLEALNTYTDNPESYKLVVSDLTMPKMGGFELAENILKINPNQPIILTTGSISSSKEQLIKRSTIEHVLKKPFDIQLLAQTVRSVLDAAG